MRRAGRLAGLGATLLALVAATAMAASWSTGPDPEALIGTWQVDLRPTPDADPYLQELVVRSVDDGRLEGSFYGTPIEKGRLNVDWGAVRFAFVTTDGSGGYNHAGVLREGRLEGTTHSLGRDFLAYWTAVPGGLVGQETGSRFDFLLGDWEGELQYLDYGDNETRVTLPTWLIVQRAETGVGLELNFLFEEPDGSTVKGGDRLYETGDGVYFGDLWTVETLESPAPDGSHRVTLSREGLDDERPATLWTTIERSGDWLTLTRTVRYEDDGDPFQRNQFRFKRSGSRQ